jgi:glycosyltransferase involved in cell wall biosynthesis
MRIAYVCADAGVPVFGRKGCSIHVQEILRAFQKQGADVTLVASRLGDACPPDLQTIPVRALPTARSGDPAERERAALVANSVLRRTFEREPRFDLIYERYSLWSFAAMEHARNCGIPGVLEVNAPLIEEQARHRTLVDRAAAQKVAERAFGAAAVVAAVSKEVAAYVKTVPASGSRVHVVPNGVNPDRFPTHGRQLPTFDRSTSTGPHLAETAVDLDESKNFTLGFVGTLKPWHGLPILVEAFDRLRRNDPGWRLLIVGDGPEREELVEDLSARGPALSGAVRLTGAVAPDEIPTLLGAFDVAIAPYPDLPDFYFSPLKVYEYMAAGLPVVASRIGQLDGLIRHDVNGLLYPPGDVSALAAALHRLRQDAELRNRLGRQARADVIAHHTWDAVVRRILQLAGVGDGAQDVDGRSLAAGIGMSSITSDKRPIVGHHSGIK